MGQSSEVILLVEDRVNDFAIGPSLRQCTLLSVAMPAYCTVILGGSGLEYQTTA